MLKIINTGLCRVNTRIMNALEIPKLTSSRQRFLLWNLVLFPAISAMFLGASGQAFAATYQVTNPNCSVKPGGFEWALQQANANPGRDTIEITTYFEVDDCKHHPGNNILKLRLRNHWILSAMDLPSAVRLGSLTQMVG